MAFELPTILMKLQIVSRNIHNVFARYKRAFLHLKSVYPPLPFHPQARYLPLPNLGHKVVAGLVGVNAVQAH